MKKLFNTVKIFIISVLSFTFVLPAFAEGYTEPQKVYDLITSSNPEYYAKITIKSQSIIVEGCFKNDNIKSVEIIDAETVSSTLKKESGGKFRSVINAQNPTSSKTSISITLESGAVLKYRLFYDDGWYFPDNGLSARNEAVLQNILPTSSKSWVGYITDEPTLESVTETLNQIAYLADYIAGDIDDDYEKLKALSKWVSENIYYDRDARDSSVTQSTICIKNVLSTKRTVCVGYAALMCALAEAQGIYAVNVKGTVSAGNVSYDELGSAAVNHEWCAALIDGKWIWVDCVWDSGRKYINGEFTQIEHDTQKYFDISQLALSFDHCAYLAEKRYYFKATEYFENQTTASDEQTTPPLTEESSQPETSAPLKTESTSSSLQTGNSTPESVDDSSSTETEVTSDASGIYTPPESYIPPDREEISVQSNPQDGNSDGKLTLTVVIVAVQLGIIALLASLIYKNRRKYNDK